MISWLAGLPAAGNSFLLWLWHDTGTFLASPSFLASTVLAGPCVLVPRAWHNLPRARPRHKREERGRREQPHSTRSSALCPLAIPLGRYPILLGDVSYISRWIHTSINLPPNASREELRQPGKGRVPAGPNEEGRQPNDRLPVRHRVQPSGLHLPTSLRKGR